MESGTRDYQGYIPSSSEYYGWMNRLRSRVDPKTAALMNDPFLLRKVIAATEYDNSMVAATREQKLKILNDISDKQKQNYRSDLKEYSKLSKNIKRSKKQQSRFVTLSQDLAKRLAAFAEANGINACTDFNQEWYNLLTTAALEKPIDSILNERRELKFEKESRNLLENPERVAALVDEINNGLVREYDKRQSRDALERTFSYALGRVVDAHADTGSRQEALLQLSKFLEEISELDYPLADENKRLVELFESVSKETVLNKAPEVKHVMARIQRALPALSADQTEKSLAAFNEKFSAVLRLYRPIYDIQNTIKGIREQISDKDAIVVIQNNLIKKTERHATTQNQSLTEAKKLFIEEKIKLIEATKKSKQELEKEIENQQTKISELLNDSRNYRDSAHQALSTEISTLNDTFAITMDNDEDSFIVLGPDELTKQASRCRNKINATTREFHKTGFRSLMIELCNRIAHSRDTNQTVIAVTPGTTQKITKPTPAHPSATVRAPNPPALPSPQAANLTNTRSLTFSFNARDGNHRAPLGPTHIITLPPSQTPAGEGTPRSHGKKS